MTKKNVNYLFKTFCYTLQLNIIENNSMINPKQKVYCKNYKGTNWLNICAKQ